MSVEILGRTYVIDLIILTFSLNIFFIFSVIKMHRNFKSPFQTFTIILCSIRKSVYLNNAKCYNLDHLCCTLPFINGKKTQIPNTFLFHLRKKSTSTFFLLECEDLTRNFRSRLFSYIGVA